MSKKPTPSDYSRLMRPFPRHSNELDTNAAESLVEIRKSDAAFEKLTEPETPAERGVRALSRFRSDFRSPKTATKSKSVRLAPAFDINRSSRHTSSRADILDKIRNRQKTPKARKSETADMIDEEMLGIPMRTKINSKGGSRRRSARKSYAKKTQKRRRV